MPSFRDKIRKSETGDLIRYVKTMSDWLGAIMAVTFEENLEKLENLVKSLEEGNTTLDESLKAFEEGIKLSRMCHKKLADAEKKIEALLKEEGTVVGRESLEF